MTKVIRVKDKTFEELVKRGRWSDTMDAIVSRILEQTCTKNLIFKTQESQKDDTLAA